MLMQQSFNDQLRGGIRAEMARQRVNQEELARRLNWGQTQVSKRLTGRVTISAEDVVKIADALQVSVSELGFPLVTTAGRGVR